MPVGLEIKAWVDGKLLHRIHSLIESVHTAWSFYKKADFKNTGKKKVNLFQCLYHMSVVDGRA